MLQLGFVSAILPDWSLEEVFKFASENDFDCVEVMCWPMGKAERRYAGVTHIDVTDFTDKDAADIKALQEKYGVFISGLGYYPNPMTPDKEEQKTYTDHIKKVIAASAKLDVNVMNTFIGRDQHRAIDDQWGEMLDLWKPIVAFAEEQGVKIGIENCPMLFSHDEWPGGKNLAYSPAVWRRLFADIPSDNFGLNFDPSHLVWLGIDYVRAIREFYPKFVHVHAKDERIHSDKLYEHGIMGVGWHDPKLPGLGSVDWGAFFAALTDTRYKGPVCIEVEDRAYEATPEDVQTSIRQSGRYLRSFMG